MEINSLLQFCLSIKEEETDAADDEEGCGSDLHTRPFGRSLLPHSTVHLNSVCNIYHQKCTAKFRGA